MNIIFFDVDGVLNSNNNLIRVYNETHKPHSGASYPFDNDCLKNFKELVEKTNSKLVLTSIWRKWTKNMRELLKVLREYELDKLLIGCTPILDLDKGVEIKKYLSDLKVSNAINFVILDDEYSDMKDLLPYIVHTNRQIGLTKENVQQAIRVLTKFHDKENNYSER